MTANGWLQIAFFSVVLLALTKPIGMYMVRVYDGSLTWLRPVERLLYKLGGVDPEEDQHWTQYAAAMLIFSLASMLLTYVALRLQHVLPLNPQQFPAVVDRQAFETAASFTTNTNWQSYSGESTMSYFSQMTQLAFHNFVSAAAGVAVAVALVRGIARRSAGRLGNFWADLVRGTLYLFLPLSIIAALISAAGCHPELPPRISMSRRWRAPSRPSRWGRSRARKRSRRSAPTVAGSSMRIRRTDSRTRRP